MEHEIVTNERNEYIKKLKRENDILRMYLREVCENADEDIPHYSRTKHFNAALKTAMKYLHKEK